jgi:thiol-disulfide isomerase/thioredoxin
MKIRYLCFALAAAALLLVGCGKSGKETAPPRTPTTTAPRAQLPSEDQPALSAGDAALLGIKTPEGDAELAWRDIETALQNIMLQPPPETPENPTKEQLAELKRKQAEKLIAAAEKARQFYTKFPKHDNAAEAKEQEQGLLTLAARFGDTNATARLEKLEQTRLDDPNLPEDERLKLRVDRLQRDAGTRANGDMDVMLTEMEAGTRKLQKEFPKRGELAGLLLQVADARLDQGDAKKARALAQEVIAGQPEAELKKEADALIAKLDRVGKPLNIKFKAVDGREVDLAGLKGKVVLIDFWATWCAPCMAELPNVKATFDKLHEKGFEIVGISLDQSVDKLKQVLAREQMSWPQYFEEDGEGNKFAEEFGIHGIPTMWLVDKQGMLRDLNGREKLQEKIEKLLSEN